MKKIEGSPTTLRKLLTGVKYTVHYYQREYRWGRKQMEELLEDLTSEFLEFYDENHPRRAVQDYGHYFLGSIVLTDKDRAIIDGQQRLTSLTLLLIYLHHIQKNRADAVDIQRLIFSEQYGTKSFNIAVPEREACLSALFNQDAAYNPANEPVESVRTIYDRYGELDTLFPDELEQKALPYFIDWLIDNVDFIEIKAHTEQDAHKIFVSMNDRGLSLTPTEMLKGFLLSEIADDQQRNEANSVWKRTMLELKELGKNEDADFLKNWLRAQYAESIREKKKGSENEDWDVIGNPFHKWVRENTPKLGLRHSDDFYGLVVKAIPQFARAYNLLLQKSAKFDQDFEHVFYNADREFTLQQQLILAALDPRDEENTISKKIKIVSCFLDQYISLRILNYKRVGYSDQKGPIFDLTLKVRRQPLQQLAALLKAEMEKSEFKIAGVSEFRLNQFTGRYMLHLLARLTRFVEEGSGKQSRFEDYVDRNIANPYDIEHIWADRPEEHTDECQTPDEFQYSRSRFGGLLLLPRDINRSLQAKPYSEKLSAYFSQNLLAASLDVRCYHNNPQFKRFLEGQGLPFAPMAQFKKAEMAKRQELYQQLCGRIWDPEKIINLAK
jgi:uncharacterized protein with ParB-like and HNH nuclease domain